MELKRFKLCIECAADATIDSKCVYASLYEGFFNDDEDPNENPNIKKLLEDFSSYYQNCDAVYAWGKRYNRQFHINAFGAIATYNKMYFKY